jgi:hypothetical protein
MNYSDLTVSEQILLSVEFLGRGLDIPLDLKTCLGSELLEEISNPENFNDRTQEPGGTSPRAEGCGQASGNDQSIPDDIQQYPV